MKYNEPMLPTRGIANKGFTVMRRFLTRFNFFSNLTGNCPQSPTGHAAIR